MTESESTSPLGDLAPRWHTYALVALLVMVAITGFALQHLAPQTLRVRPAVPAAGARILTQYAPILSVNAGLVVYACWLFRSPGALPALLGERWRDARRALADLSYALLTGFLIFGIEIACARWFGVRRNAALAALLPSTVAERLTWVLVASSVGFCEEVVYRGYLQTQLGAFTGRRTLGIALQAILFGAAHLEQGPAAALRVTGYGLILGILAAFRRSLLPGIVCHVGIDLAGGLWR